jgi:ketosteroid isomerase-like protein
MSRGDVDAVTSLFAVDAVYDGSEQGIGTFEGAEATRSVIEDWRRSYEDYRVEEEGILDLGNGVVLSVVREGGRLVGGKGRVEQRVAHLTTWANGRIEWFKVYLDPDEARAAAERLAEERGKPVSGESTTPDLRELGRRVRAAVNRRDLDAAVAMFAPDAIFDSGSAGGLIGVFEGRDAIRGVLEEWIEAYGDYEQVLEEFSDLGNGVTLNVQLARGRPAGGSGFVELRFASVSIWHNGLIERLASYTDRDQARAAAERLAEERG